MSKWTKGVLYVNGRNLGRYWNIGPQYSLYCPAPFLRKGDNQIDIIEFEDTKLNQICGLARPLVRAAAISTKNTSNVW